MRSERIFLVFVLAVLSLSLVSAEVGLGISPSKMREHVVAGDTFEYDVIVFNVGSETMDIDLVANGEMASFTRIVPGTQTVDPEPLPHEFPIKNGKTFRVAFDVPNGNKEITYTGYFSAIGKGSSNSQFGGNVAVVSQVELNVVPPTSFFSKVPPMYYLIVGIILVLILIVFALKKAGLHIQFGNSPTKPVRRKRKK